MLKASDKNLMEQHVSTLAGLVAIFVTILITTVVFLVSSNIQQNQNPYSKASGTTGSPVLPWLKTENGRIVRTDTNEAVELRGVNILRNEWVYPDMSYEKTAIPNLALTWHANLITHGFASQPVVNNDPTYLAVLDQYQQLAEQNGMYIIFCYYYPTINGDQPPRPDVDPNAQRALVSLVQRYKSKPNVLFMLQAEPHSDTFNGQYYQVTWNNLRPVYDQMITAMRAVDNPSPNKHLILASGDGWGRDISPVVTAHDPITADNAENIVYSSHPYDPPNQWGYFLPVADAGYPVLVTEFGTGSQMSQSDTLALMNSMNNGARHISWTAWILDSEGCPCLLTGDRMTLTPSSPYGLSVRDRILAEATRFDGTVTPTGVPSASPPIPPVTNTPLPLPTSTPRPTNTPVPIPTNTPVPVPTNTPVPFPTSTPIPPITEPPFYSPTPVPPSSWTGQYYNFKTPGKKLKLTRLDPAINFNWPGSPGPNVSSNNFSVRWTKTQYFAGGTYTITTRHDDGMRIWIDNQLVYNYWYNQPATTRTFSVTMASGNHTMRVEMYDSFQQAEAYVNIFP